MKLFADMHVHSKFSIDGTSTMEEYCLTAEKTGSRIICFTEHVDFNSMEKNLSIIKNNRTQNFVVDDYFCEINRLRKKYSSLTLLSGIEFSEPHLFPHEFAKYCAYPFDCITAGIHHCNNAVFPGARNLPVTEALDEYYNIMLKTVELHVIHIWHEISCENYTQLDSNQCIFEDLLVLFVGCPCQVAAIYSFLGKNHANLYTIEFICMGVNSPLAYRAWIGELEDALRAKVSNITFKYKSSGWRQSPFHTRIDFDDGHHIILDEMNNSFMRGYLMGGLFVRKCCSKCVFNGTNRAADFVVGDHWGAEKLIDDDKGTSVVILSSPHSKPLFESVKHRIECVEIKYSDVIRSNPRMITSVPYNPDQEKFYSLLNTGSFSNAVNSIISNDEPLCDILTDIVLVTGKEEQ